MRMVYLTVIGWLQSSSILLYERQRVEASPVVYVRIIILFYPWSYIIT